MDNTKIFNILAILLGLRPFGRSLLGANARKVRTANLLQLLPSLGMLILYTLCLVSMFRTRDEAASIAAAANWLQAAPNAFAFIMVIIFALKNRDLGQEILDSFVMCDEKLRDYFGINYDKVNRVSGKMSILFVFVSITSGLTVAALTFYSAVDLSNSWTLFYWASFCLPKFTLMVFNFQFVGAISFLTSRTQLLRMAVRANLSGELDALLAQMSILGKHGNAMKVRPVDSVNPTSATLVADIVGILHNLCDRVNLYFGKQLILTFLSAFICVIVQMHYIINHIRHGFAMTDAEILVSFSLALVTMHAIEFWTVLHGGEMAKVKWNETMVVLTQARGNSSDDKLRSKINDILATMKVKKLEFHAFNFFTVDLSLLTAMISAMTTYLIVLVQFKISEDEKGGDSSTNPTKQFSVES
ncbi:putative gustatory receptor 28a [Lutzomyia longipalpis]|uniref:Gustatory receptor n=1 Tax=Lutzomyia longipalpis TaxID=7200 RepID=A0A1B0C9M3_LUTLO|nr:putative gustatory receptor 28a [Lutzomyia longipalpis]